MIGKIILSLTLFGAVCHGRFYDEASVTNKEIVKAWVEFDLDVNGSKIPYRVDTIMLNYYIPRLNISRNKESNSADIDLSAGVIFYHGDFIPNDKKYGPLSYVEGQSLTLNIVGTAKLIHGGPYVKDCQFTFTQRPPIEDKLPALVKETLLNGKLNEVLAEPLCRTINETIEKPLNGTTN